MKIGDKALDFCLPNRYAQKICLKDFFGKWAVLYFFPKDPAPACTQEAVDFSILLPKFEELNAVVIGVSSDSVKSLYQFTLKKTLNIILLSDKDKETLKKYGAWKEKRLPGQTQPGLSRTTFLINPGGNIVHLWENVRVNGHANEVLNTLKTIRKKK
jgi:peroxiredoxin Q/BCP